MPLNVECRGWTHDLLLFLFLSVCLSLHIGLARGRGRSWAWAWAWAWRHRAMAWRSYNLLMDKPRVLVLDTRSSASYAAGHIRGSVCIHLDLGHKQSLCYVAGPGPPTWYPNCWWDRDVLLVLPPPRSTRKRKKAIASSSLHPVFTFLKEEGLVRSIHVLENDDSDDGKSFSAFVLCFL